MLLLSAGGILILNVILPAYRSQAGKSWVQTPCTIVSSKAGYYVNIEYTYVVSGENYRSDSYDFMEENPEGASPAGVEIVRRYPPGSAAMCYVNPARPAEAVLNRNLPPVTCFEYFLTVLTLISSWGLFSVVRRAILAARWCWAAQRQHPGKPWMWRKDWASGRVKATMQCPPYFLWLLVIPWSVGCSVTLPVVLARIARDGMGEDGAGLIAIGVGYVLLIWAVWLTAHRWKFRNSVFEMATVPATIGGELAGTIRTNRPVATLGEVDVRLACIECGATGKTVKGHMVYEHGQLWQAKKRLRPGPGDPLPVRFAIPDDAMPTRDAGICWLLQVTESKAGIEVVFEVPVFDPQEKAPAAFSH